MQRVSLGVALVFSSGLVACGGATTPTTCTEASEKCALENVKTYIQQNLDTQAAAAAELCAAAPSKAWSATADRSAIDAMKTAWKKSRPAYEQSEGAIAVLYPELDISIDERYDGFLEGSTDTNLFDDQVVTGNHAIERILYADAHPAFVIAFEKEVLGDKYVEPKFPSTDAEALDFKNKLCARWARETKQMKDDFAPLALDPAAAYRGVIGSMAEQLEKVKLAASGEEESRYAQFTLNDMRANLAAGKKTFEAFKPWLATKTNGPTISTEIEAAFTRMDALYAPLTGDSIPQPPATWSSVTPSEDDKKTPFGKLFVGLNAEADENADGSLVFELNESAQVLGIPQLPE